VVIFGTAYPTVFFSWYVLWQYISLMVKGALWLDTILSTSLGGC